MMDWSVTAAPAEEPVTASECKAWAHISTSADDTVIGQMIVAARQWTESYTGRALVTQTITGYMDSFESPIDLPKPPVASVTSVKYIDTGGTQQTLSTDVYGVDTTSTPSRIYLKYNQTWPSIRGDYHGIEIILVTGYGAASAVPTQYKSAIMMLVANMDINREATAPIELHEVPYGVKSLLTVDRVTIV